MSLIISSQITARIFNLCHGLDQAFVDPALITQKVISGVYHGISTIDLDNLAAETAASFTTLHPDYATLATRIVVSNLHKQTESDFTKVINQLYECRNPKTGEIDPIISNKVYDVVKQHGERLNRVINYRRDFDYTYFGIKTLERTYLLRVKNKIVERPQHLLMRTAIGIHGEDIEKVVETYLLMSKKYFTHASPTLFNAGTIRPQMSSCFIVAMKDDSMQGIYDTLKTCAMISKHAGGIGLHAHNIRSSGTHIAGTSGTSSGVIPMLKVFNATAKYADQGGNKRPGAFAVYLEPWHGDIVEFLEIRKAGGDDEMRARDLFSALWVPDLFMEKVEQNLDWCLFSPNDVPKLVDAYGEEFRMLYEQYEREEKYVRKISAQKLWYLILDAQIETGGPFMMYKDACNLKSNQSNIGTIRSSNLCTEIVQYSSPEEVAACNLASLALPNFVDQDGDKVWFDFDALHKVTKVVVKNLDAIIDKNWYPVEEAEVSNKRHRPVAVGIQGFADMLLALRLPFESKETKRLNIQIFETIYHGAIEASMELAQVSGPYDSYEGSYVSKGLLQYDLWQHKPTDLWDWETLKDQIEKYGVRNSLVTALMPTASTSQILGFNECFEPYTTNTYTRKVPAGEFLIVNPWLLRDLAKLGLWDTEMKDQLLKNQGSVQAIDGIPVDIKQLYKTVWEIPQRVVVELAADRAPFIDQSQSMNIYMKDPGYKRLTSMHFMGWHKGLKTGMYFLRTQPKTETFHQTPLPRVAEEQYAVRGNALDDTATSSTAINSTVTAAALMTGSSRAHSRRVSLPGGGGKTVVYQENTDNVVPSSRLIWLDTKTGRLEVLSGPQGPSKAGHRHSANEIDLESPLVASGTSNSSGSTSNGSLSGSKRRILGAGKSKRDSPAKRVAISEHNNQDSAAESSSSSKRPKLEKE